MHRFFFFWKNRVYQIHLYLRYFSMKFKAYLLKNDALNENTLFHIFHLILHVVLHNIFHEKFQRVNWQISKHNFHPSRDTTLVYTFPICPRVTHTPHHRNKEICSTIEDCDRRIYYYTYPRVAPARQLAMLSPSFPFPCALSLSLSRTVIFCENVGGRTEFSLEKRCFPVEAHRGRLVVCQIRG